MPSKDIPSGSNTPLPAIFGWLAEVSWTAFSWALVILVTTKFLKYTTSPSQGLLAVGDVELLEDQNINLCIASSAWT